MVVFGTGASALFLRSLLCVPFVVPLTEVIHCFLVLTLSNVRTQVKVTSIFCLRLFLSRRSYFILRVPLHRKLTCLYCVFVRASECNSLLKVVARRLLYAVGLLQCCVALFFAVFNSLFSVTCFHVLFLRRHFVVSA